MFETVQNFCRSKPFGFFCHSELAQNIFNGTEPPEVRGLAWAPHEDFREHVWEAVIGGDSVASICAQSVRKPQSRTFVTMIPPDT